MLTRGRKYKHYTQLQAGAPANVSRGPRPHGIRWPEEIDEKARDGDGDAPGLKECLEGVEHESSQKSITICKRAQEVFDLAVIQR